MVMAGLGLVGFLACGTSGDSVFSDGRRDPCSTIFSGMCGTTCTTDLQCPSGLHCEPRSGGLTSICTAECSPGEVCGNGVTCSPRGRCGPDDNGGGFIDGGVPASDATVDNTCADTTVTLTKVLPKVLFLLDQSSSMYFNKFPTGASNNCNPDCRWTVLKDVLIGTSASPGGLIKQLEAEAELGVELYSATDPDLSGDNSLLPPPTDDVCPRFNGKAFDGVSFALNNFTAIDSLLRPASVDDDTPTGPAIRTVVGLSEDGGVSDPKGFASVVTTAPKVLVLVTDGEPALCGESNPSDPGKAAVIAATQATFAQRIRTYVIAIGNQSAAGLAHFKAVANAGQGKDPATGDAGAILPSTPGQLVDALRNVVLDARTCTFVLNGQVPPGLESLGTVTLNGAVLPYDNTEGWRLQNPSTLELVGNACTTLKTTANASLTATFPCGVVVPR